jgi:phage I-like protein
MRLKLALLTTTLPLAATGQVQLLPAGEFAARDGRPGPGKTWRVSDEKGRSLAAAMNATIAATPIVIDYEHQTLQANKNGQPAPAAGWIRSVVWLSGKGLMADVEWTERARAAIAAGEYRYISPVIEFDKASGDVNAVHMAALTNYPALLGMDAVQAMTAHPLFNDDPSEPDMKLLLAELATFLKVPALADEAAAVAALKSYVPPKAALPEALSAALGLQAGADEAAALSAVAALKTPGTETVQLVATLQAQVTQLTARLQADEVAKAVDGAITAGKLTAAQRDQYVELGKKDKDMLTAILAAAPVIPGLAGQAAAAKAGAEGGAAGQAVTALSATQKLIADQLGLSHDAYLKQLQAEVA